MSLFKNCIHVVTYQQYILFQFRNSHYTNNMLYVVSCFWSFSSTFHFT